MEHEIWKDIPGYEGAYQASTLGRVRSLDRHVPCGFQGTGLRLVKGRVLRPGRCLSGHVSVALGKGNTKMVHILVARTFIGPPPEGQEVLHLNHTPSDNRLSNLRYGTRGENVKMDWDVGTRKVHPNFIGARWRHASVS